MDVDSNKRIQQIATLNNHHLSTFNSNLLSDKPAPHNINIKSRCSSGYFSTDTIIICDERTSIRTLPILYQSTNVPP
jgi:hypothetical protein